ncbi:alpha/beta hydrolase [Salinisphaera hydrothermalis]|uniref:alpha/beta hydrolase n=1 Tax=Salinisphaera hydrothermalis TaxID=563188 RepID=UPI003341FC90
MRNAWDRAYDNRAAVTDAEDWLAAWEHDADVFRAQLGENQPAERTYGVDAREVFDLFEPDGDAAGTLIFVHGGYWRALSRELNHQFAAGALARNWRVAFIEYPLCPDVTLESLADAVIAGIHAVAGEVDGPLVLAGHSAGGHLVTHAVTAHSGLLASARRRIRRVISISGLHDLRPIVATTDINGTLGLSEHRATVASPALQSPNLDGDLICVVGGDELPELKRQTYLLANIWTGLGVTTRAVELAGEHHFSVLEGLRSPATALTRWATPSD